MTVYDYHVCKLCSCSTGVPTYKIKNKIIIYICTSCGFHYINYLDTVDEGEATDKNIEKNKEKYEYIDKQLQYKNHKFQNQVDIIKKQHNLQSAKCLDIGAGGVILISPSKSRSRYLRNRVK